jgi:RNA polymerase sigma-70 factor (ECF subfamily)
VPWRSPLYLDGLRFDESGRSRIIEESMASHVAQSRPPLTLVAGLAIDDGRQKSGQADWSKLTARAQDGDREAYRRLLEEMTPYLRSLARRCFRELADVEDAVQDVLLTVHMVRRTYDPARPFGPWLAAIASRRIIDRLRRDTRRRACEVVLSTDHETFADPATKLDSDALHEAALGHAIARLPPEQRQTITMLKPNEMSLKEAAAASGRSIPSLKVSTHRAIKSLRRVLKRGDPP